MNATFKLGRILGVPVGFHWSVLVVAWLIAWSLASFQLVDASADQEPAVYWLVGAVAAVLFLGSLLAHELGHAVMARHVGMGVKDITLWMFGGVAQLEGEAPNARADLQVAAIGPAVSLAMAMLFGTVAAVLGLVAPDPGPAAALAIGTARWLAAMNVLLAVFNMIPAAPLDGGRVLRAILWQRHGEPLRATVTASRFGRAFGYLLTVFGLFSFLAGSAASGLWLVFIGWFVLSAAGAEETRAEGQMVLGDLPVRAAMTPDPIVAPRGLTVQRLIDEYLFLNRCSSFPVIDEMGSISGLVVLAQIKQVPPRNRDAVMVGDIAQPIAEVVTASPDDLLTSLMDRMSTSPTRRALVFDGGQLVGIVSPSDILRSLEARGLATAGAMTSHG